MPPVDQTPTMKMGNFELLYSLKAYNKIPVSEYISKKTGLTVVIAEVDGPVVNGYFCLVTEAFDDDGLPHTLEHLIFLGSESYPYKGVLDLLANRCLASGTNAWTDIDHTCYTMETAGSEGFLALMPIFLEHILYPVLSDEAFVTEVHHISETGDDAGVVYCEMQGRENSAESRLHLAVSRNIYPGKCGYSSETGGIMKNLRESTTNKKVRDYHKEFYRPENLKIVITGQVNPEEIFKSLEALEEKILAKGDRGPFERPWQNPVPALTEGSKDLIIKYPADDESNGLFCMAWRGASSVTDLYTMTATSLLLKYLTEFSVSPLPKEFVEIDDPLASNISYNLAENSESCIYISFDDVPVNKLPLIREKVQALLLKILDHEEIDMRRMESIINRYKLESLSSIETSPHQAVAFMIIGHMLYGNTKADLEQRVNPLNDLNKLALEPKSFWIGILRKYLVENTYVAVQCVPSKEEQAKMAKEEKERIEKQIEKLTESGLKEKGETLAKAVEFNDRDPPSDMLTSVAIPSIQSINFHNIVRYSSENASEEIDLTKLNLYTYFDNLKTNFVYAFMFLDTANLAKESAIYLPIILESLLELPLKLDDGTLIPYEEVVAELNHDTVSSSTSIGLGAGKSSLFKCGSYSRTAALALQVEAAKFENGIQWLKKLLHNTFFTADRLKVIATKMINTVAQAKRNGRNVASYAMNGLNFTKDSNIFFNGMLVQYKFLTKLVEDLNDATKVAAIVGKCNLVKDSLIEPRNLTLYLAGNLDALKEPADTIGQVWGALKERTTKGVNAIPDYNFLNCSSKLNGCIIGMGCIESSFFYQTTKCITSYTDPDLPALLLYLQYLNQAEGPMWKQIRGKGFAYGYTIMPKVNEGLLYLVYYRASNVIGAYKETKEIIEKQLELKEWDATLLDAAKSSLIFKIIDEENTIGNVVTLSVLSYFQGVDYKYNRSFLELIEKVTVEDLIRIGEKYVKALLEPQKVRTAIVTDPSKANEIAAGFKKFDLDLTVYPSLEESFLN